VCDNDERHEPAKYVRNEGRGPLAALKIQRGKNGR
jgi:hypothetical protein